MELTHGGDWAGYAAQYGGMPLDFSANVSPLGLPQGVRQAVARALDGADRYPDPLCRALRKKLSGTLGVPPQSILCGNGAADLIFRLALAEKPKRALVTAPTFAEYEQALAVAGCTADRFFLREEEGFAVTEALLERIEPGLDILFLCEPNNPTGRTTPRALLLRILERCAACGTRLVVDECFNEFLDDQLFVFETDKPGGRIFADRESFFLTVMGVLLLPLGRKMIDVIEPAVFAALHLLDENLFGIIFLLCHTLILNRFYL